MDSLAASSGESKVNYLLVQLLIPIYISFGLLHRIPPQPDDRTPGAMPIELQDEYEENGSDLFIPADDRRSREHTSHSSDRHVDGTRHSSRVAVSDGRYLEQNGRS
jgi:hypothetical protein